MPPEKKSDPIVIIGGGGAGMIAAWSAAQRGAPVVLVERNRSPGIKLRISGGGKCNITHSGEREEVLAAFAPNEGRFLKPSLYRFSNQDIVRLIEGHGVPTYVRPNGRVFPRNHSADDVVGTLETLLHESGVQIRTSSRVTGLAAENGRITGVVLDEQSMQSGHVVVTTGGASYQKTGTTGDGFRWLQRLGHTIVPVRAALAPVAVAPPFPRDWRGIAIRGGELSVYRKNRKLIAWRDDILFTHEGLSGPAVLEVSRTAAIAMEQGAVTLKLDFFPEADYPALDKKLVSAVEQDRRKMLSSILGLWLPDRIVPFLLQRLGIDGDKRGFVLSREERRRITGLLKEWEMGEVAQIPRDRGEVTAGGVSLTEVDPKTLRSRKIAGLYIAGEVLDIAGPIGGYNLQAAFSTGYVAGESAARDWSAARS
jgi:predicted Rossmann fold flavoprotein